MHVEEAHSLVAEDHRKQEPQQNDDDAARSQWSSVVCGKLTHFGVCQLCLAGHAEQQAHAPEEEHGIPHATTATTPEATALLCTPEPGEVGPEVSLEDPSRAEFQCREDPTSGEAPIARRLFHQEEDHRDNGDEHTDIQLEDRPLLESLLP
mmetsp:Transcript_115658/g.289028  ORF Transcript_115658/g.289028 Transcript_115658/m.289028 type:complete len:151 (+) Transcript_115658:522-974(+)